MFPGSLELLQVFKSYSTRPKNSSNLVRFGLKKPQKYQFSGVFWHFSGANRLNLT